MFRVESCRVLSCRVVPCRVLTCRDVPTSALFSTGRVQIDKRKKKCPSCNEMNPMSVKVSEALLPPRRLSLVLFHRKKPNLDGRDRRAIVLCSYMSSALRCFALLKSCFKVLKVALRTAVYKFSFFFVPCLLFRFAGSAIRFFPWGPDWTRR